MTCAVRFSFAISLQPTRFEAVTYDADLLGRLQPLAELGYAGVELAVRDPEQIDVPALERALAATGLAVPAIGTGQAWTEEALSLTAPDSETRAAARRRLRQHVALAERLRAAVIVGLIRGRTAPGANRVQALDWLAEGLEAAAAVGQAAGVTLLVEPINRYETNLVNTLADGLHLLDRVGARNVRLQPDTFHMNIEEPSIEASLRQAGPYLGHFHVADSNRRYPGAGHLDFARLLTVLRTEAGYDGWISLETLPEPEPLAAAELGLRHLRQCLAGANG
jgi:sugar phosphate isomerase/epimerase